MTVRWKPLLILSGLFLVTAMVGLMVMAVALRPNGPDDFVKLARADRATKKYDRAKIQYQNALQATPRNAALHEELAEMYAEWAVELTGEKADQVQLWRLGSLAEAAKHGKTLVGARKTLLAEAMRLDEAGEILRWAKELIELEPDYPEAHYALACERLEEVPPNLPEVKRHLASLDKPGTSKVRLAWIRARLAEVTKDTPSLETTLASVRDLHLAGDADPVDRVALLRLRALDVQSAIELEALESRVGAFESMAKEMSGDPTLTPTRINRLAQVLEQVQKSLSQAADFHEDPKTKGSIAGLRSSIESIAEATYTRSIDSGTADLALYLTYADHLRFRQKRERCLEVVESALKSNLAQKGANGELLMGLHAVAIEAALGEVKDPKRFEIAAPHVEQLLECSYPIYQGLGHLFQGAIDLEQSGVAAAPATPGADAPGAEAQAVMTASATQAKLRTSALKHLESAARLLPHLAEAQARYGVALILAREQALGRQYLAKAQAMGELDPQYQIWAAWSMVQAGYPEEADPIVTKLMSEVEAGRRPKELAATLNMLLGEIYQARRTPGDLEKALEHYDRAFADGQEPTPSVQLRLAQLDVMRNQPEKALARLDTLKSKGTGAASAEHLAVLILQEQGKEDEARRRLDAARKAYPRSTELLGLDAALLVKAKQAAEADRSLADFLATEPDNVAMVQMRAQILNEYLKKPTDARRLLNDLGERSDSSSPLVQLAQMDLKRRDFEAASETIGRIRRRWKEAAAADLLDAQLAIARGQLQAASAHFTEALKKDPANKLVLFWKAQVDSRIGATAEAARALQSIASEKPTKELENGLTLMTAAESALAKLELATGQFDSAIDRYNQLIKGGQTGETGRALRWQIVTAQAAKGEVEAATKEVRRILEDRQNPPDADDRVRAADFYRNQKDEKAATAQLDLVLEADPSFAPAVVARASMLHNSGQTAPATELIRRAISAAKEPTPAFFLMLAALENLTPPTSTALDRTVAALEQGLTAKPDSVELVQAKYRALRLAGKDDEAMAFVVEKARQNPQGSFRELVVDLHRERGQFAEAERALTELRRESPDDPRLAATLVRVVADQAIRASESGDRERERDLNDRTAQLIQEFRSRFPQELAFPQAECELAARKGEMAKATAITQEIDALSKTSPIGPLLRARIYAAQGRLREVVESYAEALDRNPRQLNVRVQLGQTQLELGQSDEAVRQASYVLEVDRDRVDALLLKARAMANLGASDELRAANRGEAARMLEAAIKGGELSSRQADLHHLLAEIYVLQGKRAEAVTTLKNGLKVEPTDATGLSQLIELLCLPARPDQPPSPADVEHADTIARFLTEKDQAGYLSLAAAVGFHKGRQFDRALPWAERASERLDRPVVHLNHGDLLLSIAETTTDEQRAREVFLKAVEQYDKVLAVNANSVEAINNKAWILHTYLDRSQEALELASGLLAQVDPNTLPGEFFDTLGSIQEELGLRKEAEESFSRGLRKVPDHPMLNYHMGRLIASDRNRAAKAGPYLRRASEGRDQLPAPMAAEVVALLREVGK